MSQFGGHSKIHQESRPLFNPPTATRCPSVVRVDKETGDALICHHTPGLLDRERVCSLAPIRQLRLEEVREGARQDSFECFTACIPPSHVRLVSADGC